MRSSKAHNTVVINNNDGYGSEIFDSAVITSEYFTINTVSFISAEHTFSEYGVSFKRSILFNKGNYLLVVDEMTPNSNELFQYSQIFHFAPGWDSIDNNSVVVVNQGASSVIVTSLSGISPNFYYGQMEPDIQGFVAYNRHEAIPVNTLSYDVSNIGKTVIATLFELSSATEHLADSQSCVNFILSREAHLCIED
jgi:hypothetical protein